MQVLIALSWTQDFQEGKNYQYQPFSLSQTFVSVISGILFQLNLQGDLTNSILILSYLKRQNGKKHRVSARFINILLSFMQSASSIITVFALIFTFLKEPNLKMIIKSFVTIAFISKIDDMFAGTLPPSLAANANDLNKNNPLVIGKDYNSFKSIFKSIKKLKY